MLRVKETKTRTTQKNLQNTQHTWQIAANPDETQKKHRNEKLEENTPDVLFHLQLFILQNSAGSTKKANKFVLRKRSYNWNWSAKREGGTSQNAKENLKKTQRSSRSRAKQATGDIPKHDITVSIFVELLRGKCHHNFSSIWRFSRQNVILWLILRTTSSLWMDEGRFFK
jgi:hypothetical protein